MRGVFYDIPRLIGKAGLWALNQPFAMIRYEAELWDSIKDDPALVAAFMNPLTNATMLAAQEVPSLVASGQELYQQVNDAAYKHFTKLAKEWEAGDWRAALQEYTAEGTEQIASFALPGVAVKLAPGVLARVPQVAAAFQAAKAQLFERVGAKLAPFVSKETSVTQAVSALATVVKDGVGMTLSLDQLESLYGLSARQAEWLANFVRTNRLVITLRSRATAALDWIKKGAVLKPEWIKLKTVNWEDVKYLGYKEEDIGRLVLKKPASRREFYDTVFPKIPVDERAEAAKRWFMRSQEWEVGDGPKMLKWAADKETPKTTFNWADNLVDPEAAPLETATSVPFRLNKEGRPVGEYLVQVVNPRYSSWASITGDVDLVAITNADGSPLGTLKHVKVLQELRESPLQIQHPETATWSTAEAKYGGKREKILLNDGKCCFGQFGADGVPRAVTYNAHESDFKSPLNYRIWFDGGYVATK